MRLIRRRRTDLLEALVHPRFYAAQVGLSPAIGVDEALDHFRSEGAATGARVTALFHAGHYHTAAEAVGVAVEGDPFEHFLDVGVARRIVPTPLYDEAHYRSHHPQLAGRDWGFADFVRDGCYRLDRQPTPYFQSYGARVPERARERHDPVLLTGMLHRAERYDLRTTSWLEEGVVATAAKLRGLDDPRVRDLVARAAAIEPEILDEGEEGPGRWVSWLPHLHPNVVTSTAVEGVRRSLPVARADALVFFPDSGPHDDAQRVVDRLRAAGAKVVVAATTGPHATPPEGLPAVDVAPHIARLDLRQRLRTGLDLVRGLAPAHVVAVDNVLATRVLARHGKALQREMTVAGRFEGRDLDLDGIVELQRGRDIA